MDKVQRMVGMLVLDLENETTKRVVSCQYSECVQIETGIKPLQGQTEG